MKNIFTLLFVTSVLVSNLFAQADTNTSKKLQDMSDPLAVFTQAGLGFTDRGLNVKIGKAYDSGVPNTMAMNVIEVQGILGDTLGYRKDDGDSVDSMRFRNFSVNTKNGRGAQVDISWNFNTKSGSASYAIIQALPKVSIFQFYPLAGLGLAFANGVDQNRTGWADANSPSGLSIPGAYVTLGMYSKITITKKIWINYNPIWLSSVAGSDTYQDNAYGIGNSSLLTHEVAMSYQITPRFNVRYFANWSDKVNFLDGGQRIEFNYQL